MHGVPSVTGLLVDLDETLIVDTAAVAGAFLATAAHATAHHEVSADALAAAARARARELWSTGPLYGYCSRIAMSSWEGLWCSYAGDEPEPRQLETWACAYRRETWRLALGDHGIRNATLVEELADRFSAERRARHEVYAEVPRALEVLSDSYRMALVTNGASYVQREKLRVSGLADYFEVVVVSGDIGVKKPDASVFRRAAELLGSGEGTVMIGDSLVHDIVGALGAGYRAIWVNRSGSVCPEEFASVPEVTTITEIPAVLDALE